MRFFALIPARAGSKRIKDKNLCKVGSLSLIANAVHACANCLDIAKTYIVSDCPVCTQEGVDHGAFSLGLRPPEISHELSPDRDWIYWFLSRLDSCCKINRDDYYVVVRATSPFRTSVTISNAIQHFKANCTDNFTSLRSVKPVSEHPGKMWVFRDSSRMVRLLPFDSSDGTPWCDSQNTMLPSIFVQNASLEISNIRSMLDVPSFPTSGYSTIPFMMSELESIDINLPLDLELARIIYEKQFASG